ncbi:MAG: DNA-binding protein [Actinomycetota bacterium]|nr:DNA-binding protein [Actinomycetota bacterium]
MSPAMPPAEVLALPAVVDVPTAARALGIGTTLAYELAKNDQLGVPVLRLGRLYRVPRAGLLEALGLTPNVREAGPASPATAPLAPAASKPLRSP